LKCWINMIPQKNRANGIRLLFIELANGLNWATRMMVVAYKIGERLAFAPVIG
jgi:hypothetical protein